MELANERIGRRYTWPTKNQLIKNGLGAALASLTIVAPVEANTRNDTPVERTADRLEYGIQHDIGADFNPYRALLWTKPGFKGVFLTSVPLIARVGQNRRVHYFGLRQEGKTRKTIRVIPMPKEVIKSTTSYYVDNYCNPEDLKSFGKLVLRGENRVPSFKISNGTGSVPRYVPAGLTRHYKDGVVMPPTINPDQCD